jgi:hypothetical protein
MLHPLYNWKLRLYAADIFMGTYETSEMMTDVTESSYELDDDGNVLSRTNN